MNELLLEKIGLTKGEIKVFLALNKLGETTVTPIVKDSGVSKSKIYDILEKLIQKGLVGYILKNKVKYFTANDPHMIIDYLEKKEKEIESTKQEMKKFIPELLLQRKITKNQPVAEMYEGLNGIKAIREELTFKIKPNDTLLVMGAPKIANEKWEAWFLEYHKKRIKQKINLKILYNSDAKKYGKIREQMKLTEVKYLPNSLVSPNWIDIYEDAVLFIMILKTPIAFVIRDKELANSFRNYFEIMWKLSK